MSNAIWKYQLHLTDRQSVEMPSGAKILSVAEQEETLCLWALVDTKAPFYEMRQIEIVGTGNPIPSLAPPQERTFIGTVVTQPFVWHVFSLD